MIKEILIILFLILLSNQSLLAQKYRTVSLHEHSIDSTGLFKVNEIIDARKDKVAMGVIQRGLNNKKDISVFKTPGLQEVQLLLERSGMITSENGIVLRFTKVWVSEFTTFTKETGRAEVSIDFFYKKPGTDLYYFISSNFASYESTGGIDVTDNHDENIVEALRRVFLQFWKENPEIDFTVGYEVVELSDPELSFRKTYGYPILNSSNYKNGYHKNFNEFIDNNPSLDINCDVDVVDKSVTVCGKKTELFGYARDGGLFIFFYGKFYGLFERSGKFYFNGPKDYKQRQSQGSSAKFIDTVYTIDFETGSIKSVEGM